MKRLMDIIFSIIVMAVLVIPFVLIVTILKLNSRGPALYWSVRVGKNNKNFNMPKLRTMHLSTPQVATHLLNNPEQYLTSIGSFLRKTSLDEVPQFWNILKGEMSFVGPRPALFNQDDLISLRVNHEVHTLTPGLTGWAQVNGRDELTLEEKVRLDSEYLRRKSFWFDLYILGLTVIKVLKYQGVSH